MDISVVIKQLFANPDVAGVDIKSPTTCSNSWVMLKRLMLRCFIQSPLTFHYISVALCRGRE